MKTKIKTCEYRLCIMNGNYSIIKVFYDAKGKITSHSSFIYPCGFSEKEVKLQISDMLKATRKPALTEKDLNDMMYIKE